MKIKKLVIILISIIVPLVITVLVGLYSYGAIGDWTNNQEDFVDYVFDEAKTSKDKVDLYVKFNSGSYKVNTTTVEIFDDYNSTILPDSNGVFEFDGFKMASYVLVGDDYNKKYSYNFYFYDIDNSKINFSNVAFVPIQTNDVNNTSLLYAELTSYKEEFLNGELDKRFMKNLDYASKNIFFTTGEKLEDVNGIAEIVDGLPANRLIPYFAPDTLYSSGAKFAGCGSCQFAVVELKYDSDSNPEGINILTTGKITNIAADEQSFIDANPDLLEGYTLNTFDSVKKAGYAKYIWKTVLLHSAITLVITGILGFFFYKTWSFAQEPVEAPKNKYQFKKKNK